MMAANFYFYDRRRSLDVTLVFSVATCCGVIFNLFLQLSCQQQQQQQQSTWLPAPLDNVVARARALAAGRQQTAPSNHAPVDTSGRRHVTSWHCQWQDAILASTQRSSPHPGQSSWYDAVKYSAEKVPPLVPQPELVEATGSTLRQIEYSVVFAIMTHSTSVEQRVQHGALLSWARLIASPGLAAAVPDLHTNFSNFHVIILCPTCVAGTGDDDDTVQWMVGPKVSTGDLMAVALRLPGRLHWLVLVEDTSFVDVPVLMKHLTPLTSLQHAISLQSPQLSSCPCQRCASDCPSTAALALPRDLVLRYVHSRTLNYSTPAAAAHDTDAPLGDLADIVQHLGKVLQVDSCLTGRVTAHHICRYVVHVLDESHSNRVFANAAAITTCLSHSHQFTQLFAQMLLDWTSRLYFNIEFMRSQLQQQESLWLGTNTKPEKDGMPTSSTEVSGDLCPGDMASSSSQPDYSRLLQQQQRITWNVHDRSSRLNLHSILTNSGRAGPVRSIERYEGDSLFIAGDVVGKKVNIGRVSGRPIRGHLWEASLRFCPAYGYQYTLNILLSAKLLDGNRQYTLHRKLDRFQLVPSFHIRNKQPVAILLPVSMAGPRFQDFMAMYEYTILQQHLLDVRLVVMLLSTNRSVAQSVSAAISTMKQRYSWADIAVHVHSEAFSRGKALHYAASLQGESDLMFFCDVDITFSLSALKRCKENTIPQQQVYSPIPFALYDPQFVQRARKSSLSSVRTSSYNASTSAQFYQIIDDMAQRGWPPHKSPISGGNSSPARQREIVDTGAIVDSEHGHWLEHSYGMLCIYRQDYMHAGGFDVSITGWGGEDVDLADRLTLAGLELFRSPDPELIHRWHEKHCHAGTLSDRQMIMCKASQSESIASQQVLTLVHSGT